MSIDIQKATELYAQNFDAVPTLICRAPGRVNLIGEHTDYNHGYVLPMAIERETLILATPRKDMKLNAYAANMDRFAQADLAHPERDAAEPWIDYVVGVAKELADLRKPIYGAEMMIIGDVPVGCGLSSSASLEMAALVMFEQFGGFTIEGPEAPKLGQRVENNFLGLNSGIMDQFISRLGKADHALFLDCRSLECELIPAILEGARFVIANTGVTRGLTSSTYNERVTECAEAVEGMRACLNKEGTHLRDFDLDDLEAARGTLADVPYRRARHVISEDQRTVEACACMRSGDLEGLGVLMTASDESLATDYEVSCEELMAMTEIARGLDGCYGSRMTGAGFGGCTVSLVRESAVDAFSSALLERYTARTDLKGAVIESRPADGAGVVSS